MFPAMIAAAGASLAAANGTYTKTADFGGEANYQGTDVQNFIRLYASGSPHPWILFVNDNPIYQGGAATGPTSTDGAWQSIGGGPNFDPPPTVTAVAPPCNPPAVPTLSATSVLQGNVPIIHLSGN